MMIKGNGRLSALQVGHIMLATMGHHMRSVPAGNRVHRNRAPNGSPEALERIAAAEAKRARKLAKAAKR